LLEPDSAQHAAALADFPRLVLPPMGVHPDRLVPILPGATVKGK